MATLFGSYACEDPKTTAESCAELGVPTAHWTGKANTFRLPVGEEPGRGHILLRLATLQKLVLTTDHDLAFSGEDAKHVVTLSNITLRHIECITPGYSLDTAAVYLCEVVDRRYHLARIPINTGYNVRSADGTGYLTNTKNGGSAWTWQQIATDLTTTLGISTLTLPFTPDATPENLKYWGKHPITKKEWNAWSAYNDLLARIACTVIYNPVTDTFSLKRLGVDGDTELTTLANASLYKGLTWDTFATEYVRSQLPEKVRVLFRRRPEPKDGTSPFYAVDVTLTATTGVKSGTYIQLEDDLSALGATGAPTNASALATRASERATDWRRKRLSYERLFLRVYRDFQPGALDLLGSAVGTILFDDTGIDDTGMNYPVGVMQVAVRSEEDGLLERWAPLAGCCVPEGAEATQPPATTTQDTVPTFDGTGNLQLSQMTIVPSTVHSQPAVTQYTVANVGDSPTTNPVVQYVIENDSTGTSVPRIRQYILTGGTGSGTGQTTTIVPTRIDIENYLSSTNYDRFTLTPTTALEQFVLDGMYLYQALVGVSGSNRVDVTTGNSDQTQGVTEQFTVDNANDRVSQIEVRIRLWDGSSVASATNTATAASGVVTQAFTGTYDFSGATVLGISTGAFAWTVTAVKTSAYTAAIGELVRVDSSGGAFTVTLPTAVGNSGKQIAVKRTNSSINTVTIATTSSQTIDGSSTYSLSSSPSFGASIFVSDGSNWMVLSGTGAG